MRRFRRPNPPQPSASGRAGSSSIAGRGKGLATCSASSCSGPSRSFPHLGITFTYALVAAPLHYRNETVGIHIGDPIEFVPEFTYQHDGWAIDISPITLSIADGELLSLYVDSLAAALAVSAVGVLVGLVVLHLLNAVAWLFARYTELLLRNTQPSIFSEPAGTG